MKNSVAFLLGIGLFAFLLRIIYINALPATLNIDEAALGYNAFSILKTGADEHGVFLPLALQSFGDWKLPVYSYLDVLSIAFLGISKLSVRLPSILAGTASVFLIYFIAYSLFKNRAIGLIASLFLAISPWSIFFSRGAYEVNVATAFFLGGVLLLLKFLEKRRTSLLISSYILFAITLFTYHSYLLLTPLFVLVILFLHRGVYMKKSSFLITSLLFAIVIVGSFFILTQGGNKKTSNLNIFSDQQVIYDRADKVRGDAAGDKNVLLEKVLYNKYAAGFYQLGQNYLGAFAPSVLLDKGGERLTHNIGNIGYFYLVDALFFFLGLFFLLWKREKKILLTILPWIILAPIPSALTSEHTGTRLYPLVPPLILVCSYGFYQAIFLFHKRWQKRLAAIVFSGIVLVSFVYFLNYYFVHFNTQRMAFWKYGYEDAVKISQKYPDYNIVMRGPENFPYIYFLLYNEYDPKKFREEVVYYPVTNEGFVRVKSFGKYTFPDLIDYGEQAKNTIYFDDINISNTLPAIKLPSGDVMMKYNINK